MTMLHAKAVRLIVSFKKTFTKSYSSSIFYFRMAGTVSIKLRESAVAQQKTLGTSSNTVTLRGPRVQMTLKNDCKVKIISKYRCDVT